MKTKTLPMKTPPLKSSIIIIIFNWHKTQCTIAWIYNFTLLFNQLTIKQEFRTVGRFGNPGVPVVMVGIICPHSVEIGLTDLPKTRGTMATPAPSGTTGLHRIISVAI